MFKKILIANRGEIACRIIRTAQRLGIRCVAIFSDIDADALHVKMADEAYLVGSAPSRDSYLKMDEIISIAKKSGADAIHPGYGFLSENAEFAAKCSRENICFIGPSAAAINAMGSKSHAKEIMSQAGVPITPGYFGKLQSLSELQKEAKKIGYPILLKPAAGGGGKGMRLVNHPDEFAAALASAKREAKSSFDDEQMLIEKYLPDCRHIEVQIFGDNLDNYVYLFERDCSLQRRHQKIIEEAPAPHITKKLRQQLGEIAIKAAKAIDYVNAGTIEFLMDAQQNFYFMEMNTRLQVEHPVTEMITGQDLVEWQLKIASGEPLPLTQDQLNIHGHAFEARIYAEDPDKNFMPSIGKLIHLKHPAINKHVRIDNGVKQGDQISIYYDPLIAKLIVWDKNRLLAMEKLAQALSEYQIVGINTNIAFLKKILQQPEFIAEKINTQFIDKHPDILKLHIEKIPMEILAIATFYILQSQQKFHEISVDTNEDINSPWFIHDNWQLNSEKYQTIQFIYQKNKILIKIIQKNHVYNFIIDDKILSIEGEFKNDQILVNVNGQIHTGTIIQHNYQLHIFSNKEHFQIDLYDPVSNQAHAADLNSHLIAPMPGTVTSILVNAGQTVNKGDSLLVIEAMKMEHTIIAPQDGSVEQIYFQVGDIVEEGKQLLKFKPL